MMKAKYLCPYCKGVLNVKGNVILAARNLKDIDNKGLVFLHEEIGNYSSYKSGSLQVNAGDVVNFYCPVCQESLDIAKGGAGWYYPHGSRGPEIYHCDLQGVWRKIFIPGTCRSQHHFLWRKAQQIY